MKTLEEKKEFALSQIAPYYNNPETCGYDKDEDACLYLCGDGRMCVAGKNMIEPKKDMYGSIVNFITEEDDSVLKPEVRGYLTSKEWESLQGIHDIIARGGLSSELILECNLSGLFTIEELTEYAYKIKQ